MTNNKHFMLIASAATTLMLNTACVDNNYDLSDIDGTIGINVNELTIPLNVDSLSLNQVIDLDENDEIKEFMGADGKIIYAITKEGEFNSDPICIESFNTEPANIDNFSGGLDLRPNSNAAPRINFAGRSAAESRTLLKDQLSNLATYDISNSSTEITIDKVDVDKSIVNMQKIEFGKDDNYKMTLDIDKGNVMKNELSKNNLGELEMTLSDLKIQLPSSLAGTFHCNGVEITSESYDAEKGILDLSGKNIVAKDGLIDIELNLNSLDYNEKSNDIHFENNQFWIEGKVGVVEGALNVGINPTKDLDNLSSEELVEYSQKLAEFQESIPDNLEYDCATEMSSLNISKFSGKVEYDINNISIAPISIDNLPDFLNNNETNIVLSNPQIYISVNNPLKENNVDLNAEAGLSIHAERTNGYLSDEFTLDGNSKLNIDEKSNIFCLAPSKPATMQEGYENASFYAFTNLANIMSGNGLPEKLHIDVTNPKIPEQDVENFELSQQFSSVKGKYYLFAPLAFNEQTSIIYADTIDGWNDETIEKLTIDKIKVTARIKSDIPLSFNIMIWPIDVNGNKIKNDNGLNIQSSTVSLDANGDDDIEFIIEDRINGLDGIIIEAVCNGSENNTPISPTQNLDVKNLRVTVSGQYIDEM